MKFTQMSGQSLEALAQIGTPTINPLIEALQDENTRDGAVKALAQIGEPAIDPIHKALWDNDPKVREAAAKILKIIENN